MTGGQHQTLSVGVTSAESVSFITLTQEKQKLKTFQNGIAVREWLLYKRLGGG